MAPLAAASQSLGGKGEHDSCTKLPTYAVLGDVERELGVPVLSANETLMWGLCQAAGIPLGGAPNSLTRLTPAAVA